MSESIKKIVVSSNLITLSISTEQSKIKMSNTWENGAERETIKGLIREQMHRAFCSNRHVGP